MPSYTVTSPDGTKVTLTGDQPPTKDQLDKIFAQIKPENPNLPGADVPMTDHEKAKIADLKAQGYPEDYARLQAKASSRPDGIYAGGKKPTDAQFMAGFAKAAGAAAFAPEMAAKDVIQASGQKLQDAAPNSLIAKGVGGAIKLGAEAIPTNPVEKAQFVLGGKAVDAAAPYIKPLATKALGFMAQKFGGLAADTVKVLEDNAPAVVKYARMGSEKAAEAAAEAAKTVKGHIDEYAAAAGEKYRTSIEELINKNPEYNSIRINAKKMAGDSIDKIRNDFGFANEAARLPNLELVDSAGRPIKAAQGAITRVGKAEADVKLFNEFADQFKDGMTPTQAYYLQRDLSQSIAANSDKPIAVALRGLKKEAVKAFDSSVQGTPIASINNHYRVAMNLVEDLSKVSNADNAVSVINSAFRNRSETRDALNTIATVSPDVKSQLDNLFAAKAGEQVAHLTRQGPETGSKALYVGGLGAAGAGVLHNPVTGIPMAAAYMAGTSPRAYGEAMNAVTKMEAAPPPALAPALIVAMKKAGLNLSQLVEPSQPQPENSKMTQELMNASKWAATR